MTSFSRSCKTFYLFALVSVALSCTIFKIFGIKEYHIGCSAVDQQ